MIKIAFTDTGKILSLRLLGHAGYAEIGKDIVCASASILAYTVAQFVSEAERQGDLESLPTIKLEAGDIHISCEPCRDNWKLLQNVFLFAKMGYIVLSNNYPQYVEIITTDDKADALT